MPKDVWDAAVVVASLSRFFALGECHAREYLTTLDDADATMLCKCLRRLGWWFPDDQHSAQERLVWWLFRDDVTRLDFSDGTERRRIETSEERLGSAFRWMKSLANAATIPGGSCLSVANYVRGALRLLERNEPPLGHQAIQCGWPEHGGLGVSHIRFDGECLNDALNAAARQLNLQPGQLHWQEATGHWLTTERREFDDVRRLLTGWRDVLEREIQEREELPPGWEATDTTWPDCPIKTVEDVRPWLSSWLAGIHNTRSSGSWSSPESYLDDVQRELRNTRRAMRAWGISLPPQFNDNPASIIEAEKQLELLIDLLGATTSDPQPATVGIVDDTALVIGKTPDGEQQPPNAPKVYLSSWRELLDALGKDNNTTEQRRVRAAHKKFPGPIIMPTHGGQPTVVKTDLLVWWNGLEDRYHEEATVRDSLLADRSATLENQFDLGRGEHTETVVPDIAGRVKRRRGST